MISVHPIELRTRNRNSRIGPLYAIDGDLDPRIPQGSVIPRPGPVIFRHVELTVALKTSDDAFKHGSTSIRRRHHHRPHACGLEITEQGFKRYDDSDVDQQDDEEGLGCFHGVKAPSTSDRLLTDDGTDRRG